MTNNLMTDDRAQVAAAKVDRVMEPCTLVLFGASGDLAQRMVVPAIFGLARHGLLSPEFRLIGYARSKMTDDEFRQRMRKAVRPETGAGDEQAWTEFAACLSSPRLRTPGVSPWVSTHPHCALDCTACSGSAPLVSGDGVVECIGL